MGIEEGDHAAFDNANYDHIMPFLADQALAFQMNPHSRVGNSSHVQHSDPFSNSPDDMGT
jgi:hypothetical protein